MRNHLRLIVLAGGATLIAGAAFLVACSDDDTSVTTDSGIDGGADSRSDAPVTTDSGGGDTGVDSSFDGGFVLDTFDQQMATELCKSLARCCYGTATPAPDGGADGGTFDMAACEVQYGKLGFEGSNISTLRDGGNVSLDQVAADSCLNKIKAASCNLPGPEFKQIRDACFSVYTGKLGANAACKGSSECQVGSFCKGAVDGGAGTCTAIRAVGAACGDFTDDPVLADEACSYRRGGAPANYCNFYDFTAAGDGTLDAGDWKCAAPLNAGASCANSLWCNQTLCDPGSFTCVTPDKYFDQSCTRFVK
jgi:hypothetical protein